jgi:hypothetical protein
VSTATGRPAAEPAALHAWADLLTRQLAALETGDVDAFLELAGESDAAAADARDQPVDPAALQACAELLGVVQERLRAARDAARAELRELDERSPAVMRYAQATAASHIDVRL